MMIQRDIVDAATASESGRWEEERRAAVHAMPWTWTEDLLGILAAVVACALSLLVWRWWSDGEDRRPGGEDRVHTPTAVPDTAQMATPIRR